MTPHSHYSYSSDLPPPPPPPLKKNLFLPTDFHIYLHTFNHLILFVHVTAIFFLIGVAVYGGLKPTGLGYSYAFTVLSMCLNLAAAGLNMALIRTAS